MSLNDERIGKSTVFISEHRFFPRMQSVVRDLNKKTGGNLVVVADTAFARLAKLFHIEAINVNTSHNINRYWCGRSEYIRLGILPFIANITGDNKRFGNNGEKLITLMFDTLLKGKNLLISPTGASNPNAKWLSGVGFLSKKIHQEGLSHDVDFRFVYIPPYFGDYRLSKPIPFELLESQLDLNGPSRRISIELSELFDRYKVQK